MERRTALIVVFVLAFFATGVFLTLPWQGATVPGPKKASLATFSDFAGKQVCAECHSLQHQDHAASGHARTFHIAAEFSPAQRLNGQVFDDQERHQQFKYEFAGQEGLITWIPGLFQDAAFPLPYVLGSNTHAATFLTLLPTPNGETGSIEHRVSIFGDQLGLTPSHKGVVPREEVEHFGVSKDPVTTRACIGCHSTYFKISGSRIEHLIANVDCEACHGAGGTHANNMRDSKSEFAIERLSSETKDSAIAQIENCGRCHRLPTDVAEKELRPSNWKLVRFQPVGMLQSRCVTQSSEAFSCTTCHDPHASGKDSIIRSQAACMKCHSPAQMAHKTCPVSARDNCLECHMPKVEIHRGIFFRDHWIRVRNESEERTPPPDVQSPAPRDSNL